MRSLFSTLWMSLLFSLLLISCGKEPADKEAPKVLVITSPADSAQFTGDILHFKASFSDNVNLSQYKLQIVPSAGNFFPEDSVALSYWDFTRVYEIDGMDVSVFPDISIPDTIASGWYDLIVNTVDASGNLSTNDSTSIYIRNQIDYFEPYVLLLWPADLQTFSASDTLRATAAASDNISLSSTQFKVYASNQLLSSATQNNSGTNSSIEFRFPLTGLSAGTYRYEITQYDGALNSTMQSRMFVIQ